MNNKLISYSVYASIVFSVIYFINSITSLVGYAVSNNIVSRASSPIIGFVISHYAALNIASLSILFIASILIYSSYYSVAKRSKSLFLRILTVLLAIAILAHLFFTSLSFLNPNSASFLPFPVYQIENYSSILFLIFGIALLLSKLNNKLTKLIGTLYILESLILFSSIFIPIRLAEFTIALRIAEAFFFKEEKSKLKK